MGTLYTQLSSAERATLMVMLAGGHSQSAVARHLERDRSTVSRELARNGARPLRGGEVGAAGGAPELPAAYDARLADARALALRAAPALHPKLAPDTPLFAVVQDQLRAGWSPEQIAGILQRAYPDDPSRTVVHETIYTAIHIMPQGALKRELVACLRQGRGKRRPRSRGQDRRGRIADMVSLHVRPPEVADRLVPGHWEGDLIKGAGNRSSVGTLVERSSRLVVLVRLDNATAEGVLAGFTTALNRVPAGMRKTMTYDQGKEMACHKALAAATNIAVYFADPHSPWQRGSNENTNGLLRQYLPKGTDLSVYTQDQLDAIAFSLNTRPRKLHGFRSPLEMYRKFLSSS
jgi:transposase, IS30 family